MSDAFVQVAPDSIGKKIQTFENMVGGNTVEAQAVVLVDPSGVPVSYVLRDGGKAYDGAGTPELAADFGARTLNDSIGNATLKWALNTGTIQTLNSPIEFLDGSNVSQGYIGAAELALGPTTGRYANISPTGIDSSVPIQVDSVRNQTGDYLQNIDVLNRKLYASDNTTVIFDWSTDKATARASLGAGTGDGNVTGQSSSVDGEAALFSGTNGKTIKRATGTGIAKLTSGILGTAAGSDIPNIAESQVTNLTSDLALKAPLASPSLTGTPTAPTASQNDNSTKLATTAYADLAVANAVAGVNPAVAVQAATTAAGDTSGFTYSNGVGGIGATLTGPTANVAVAIDGYTFTAVGQRLLVKNDTQSPSGAFNGVYFLSTLQIPAVKPVFTRALDYDMPSDINNTGAIPVVNGTVNADTSWLLTSQVSTVGTDPLTYVQFSINPTAIVQTSRTLTIGGTAQDLSANRTWLANVTNDAQTKSAVVPNTAPGAGQLLVGNAGGTAYAPVTISGSGTTATMSSAGVLTLSAIANATLSNSSITIGGASTALGGTVTTTTMLDSISSTQGVVLYRDSSAWAALATGTAGKLLRTGGSSANPAWTIPTYPNAATTGAVLSGDGTNIVLSTPTFPTTASATSRKIIVSDGTNWVASTETYATPGTSGNVLKSDGTNWTSSANNGGYAFLGVVTGSNFTTTTTTGDGTDITGLVSGTLTNSTTYELDGTLWVTNAGDTAGSKISVHCTGTPGNGNHFEWGSGALGSAGIMQGQAVNIVGGAIFNTGSSALVLVMVKALITTGTSSVISIRIQKQTSGTAQVNIGSTMKLRVAGT